MKLLLLFTPRVSIEIWERAGYLSRELEVYGRLAREVGEVWWYTHGPNDSRYESTLAEHGLRLFSPDARLWQESSSPKEYDRRMLASHLPEFSTFDVVKTNQFDAWRLAAELKRRCGLPFLLRRGAWIPLRHRWYTRRPLSGLKEFLAEPPAYRAADQIILTSDEARKYLIRNFQVPEEKVTHLSNGIDVERFRPAARPAPRTGQLRLLYVGRLAYAKNPQAVLQAARRLPAGQVTIHIIGQGRYKEELRRMAEAWRLQVIFTNRVDNHALPGVYADHDVFVLPSRWEGNPKALLEAMACGRCVIGANVFGIREVIRHGENGLIYDGGAAGLARAIASVVDDELLRRRLGEAARQYVLDHCQMDDLIRREAGILKSLVGI